MIQSRKIDGFRPECLIEVPTAYQICLGGPGLPKAICVVGQRFVGSQFTIIDSDFVETAGKTIEETQAIPPTTQTHTHRPLDWIRQRSLTGLKNTVHIETCPVVYVVVRGDHMIPNAV